MALKSNLGNLLLYFGLYGICTGFLQENCTNYMQQFERVYSVPGDAAMLNSTLVSPDVFNYTSVPYNITWYNLQTGQEINSQRGRVLVMGETLWLLNLTLADDGEYLVILRTPVRCYQQSIILVVDLPSPGLCGKPRKIDQILTKGVSNKLSCPLKDYINKLNSYNISSTLRWYRGCDIINNTEKYIYKDKTKLLIKGVDSENHHSYTCTLSFNLGGGMGSVSETIDAVVREGYFMVPQVREPTNTAIKVHVGSSFTQRCRVFVPGYGLPCINNTCISWYADNKYIASKNPSDRIYKTQQPLQNQYGLQKGVWLEVLLTFKETREEDFFINYTCQAQSSRGHPQAYFTLLPEDPDVLLPIGAVFSCLTFLFIISISIYYLYKVDIVLWFRSVFPVFYTNTDSDGKLYDAYVAYPQPSATGYNEEVEAFALQTLPEVLERSCGYKLFIAGRDCLPGEAMVDSVEENIQASRCLLLLYSASTFPSKTHTSSTSSTGSSNNNNHPKNYIIEESDESKSVDVRSSSSVGFNSDADEVHSDSRQQMECLAAMHRSLLEGSLKVVLVELEEITPAQLALFPESVRHLRKKQGAVCWWKERRAKKRWSRCGSKTGNVEQDSKASPSVSPSSMFWKEIRYHMPVRGKRVAYPEKTALLNL
ncbi:interleukin-1 receptor-like 2 isoform X3 [Cynoglossus semilaevis]|uniref:interleukin-1 receptor-like 2 isoform X3 n=1 Tax=Cynoglossus semilaevis TaxID=244447 RepID=UPI000497D044|nr:interleukin-1 receptor-like 2 isoform X3 [Cynoglossus semilaevis]